MSKISKALERAKKERSISRDFPSPPNQESGDDLRESSSGFPDKVRKVKRKKKVRIDNKEAYKSYRFRKKVMKASLIIAGVLFLIMLGLLIRPKEKTPDILDSHLITVDEEGNYRIDKNKLKEEELEKEPLEVRKEKAILEDPGLKKVSDFNSGRKQNSLGGSFYTFTDADSSRYICESKFDTRHARLGEGKCIRLSYDVDHPSDIVKNGFRMDFADIPVRDIMR